MDRQNLPTSIPAWKPPAALTRQGDDPAFAAGRHVPLFADLSALLRSATGPRESPESPTLPARPSQTNPQAMPGVGSQAPPPSERVAPTPALLPAPAPAWPAPAWLFDARLPDWRQSVPALSSVPLPALSQGAVGPHVIADRSGGESRLSVPPPFPENLSTPGGTGPPFPPAVSPTSDATRPKIPAWAVPMSSSAFPGPATPGVATVGADATRNVAAGSAPTELAFDRGTTGERAGNSPVFPGETSRPTIPAWSFPSGGSFASSPASLPGVRQSAIGGQGAGAFPEPVRAGGGITGPDLPPVPRPPVAPPTEFPRATTPTPNVGGMSGGVRRALAGHAEFPSSVAASFGTGALPSVVAASGVSSFHFPNADRPPSVGAEFPGVGGGSGLGELTAAIKELIRGRKESGRKGIEVGGDGETREVTQSIWNEGLPQSGGGTNVSVAVSGGGGAVLGPYVPELPVPGYGNWMSGGSMLAERLNMREG